MNLLWSNICNVIKINVFAYNYHTSVHQLHEQWIPATKENIQGTT